MLWYKDSLVMCILLFAHWTFQAAATTNGLTNLGLGLDGAASASSILNSTYAAFYAIDGALSTECRTQEELSPWFQVILQEDKMISTLRIFSDVEIDDLVNATVLFFQEREFELVKILDGSSFTRIYGEAIDDLPVEFAYQAVLDSPVVAKTLRLTYIGYTTEIWMSEFQIWGQSVAPSPTDAPVSPPSAPPSNGPVPSASPTRSPSSSTQPSSPPTTGEPFLPAVLPEQDCDNLGDAYFRVPPNGADQRDCEWLEGQTPSTVDDMCTSPSFPVSQVCFSTCSTCLSRRAQQTTADSMPIEGCEDLENVEFPFISESTGITKNCGWLRGQPEEVMEAYCESTNPAFHICEDTCGKCIDVCQDDHSVFLDPYQINPQRQGRAMTCSQLANLSREIGAACQVPQIRDACQDTCNSCSVPTAASSTPPLSDAPSSSPSTVGDGN